MPVSSLDGAGQNVTGEPWAIPTPGKLLISEAVWPTLMLMVNDRAKHGTQSLQRKCQQAVEKLALHGSLVRCTDLLGNGFVIELE
jgi:hypothetical protein